MVLAYCRAVGPAINERVRARPQMKKGRIYLIVSTSVLLAACSTISTYDQAAYGHATSAKVDTLTLMDKAAGSWNDHQKEIAALTNQLDKAYEYDRGRPLNKITVAQWEILRDPNRELIGGFLRIWEVKGSLSQTFITEKKAQVADAFDQIIQLESGKLRPSQTK